MKKFITISSLVPILFIAGCSQIPSYEHPKTELPKTWPSENAGLVLQMNVDDKSWWQQLSGDQSLQTLIDEALEHNSDIALAKLNLLQAQSLLKQSQSSRFPEIGLTAGLSRTQTSDEAYPQFTQTSYGNFSLGTLLSYELDLWGKVDALNQQAEANLNATQADYQTVKLTVSAAVANAYLNLMALNQDVELAENTVQSRKEALELRQTQLEYGSVTPLSVHQAEAELASVELAFNQQQVQRDLQLHALAVLVGRSPKSLMTMSRETLQTNKLTLIESLPLPNILPSELLERRPDILAAEQRLIAANANIGLAKAALFPSISLTGLVGFQSEALNRLFAAGSNNWNASADINAPIFDYGRRQTNVEVSEIEKQAMLIQYQQTIRTAFKEVLDAMTQLEGSYKQLEAQQHQVTALQQTLDLAQTRFDAGYSSYLEVLDAQRNLFSAELSQVAVKLTYSTALVNLYKALGGNWETQTAKNPSIKG
ncbi:RND transporter [Thiomicrorhabdus immobilis]|uniref:RND transporter n=1 Tax=Thiomicrorhabdus immobilis TaxID=2791037 RepID=A0ABM7MB75_9GAMM|nr:efflux transporter outer membrane subunit [Thiomicrorhabdus immobilis]BCN92608.1 RND transporter [Thiomicrorhabdus immobilis]